MQKNIEDHLMFIVDKFNGIYLPESNLTTNSERMSGLKETTVKLLNKIHDTLMKNGIFSGITKEEMKEYSKLFTNSMKISVINKEKTSMKFIEVLDFLGKKRKILFNNQKKAENSLDIFIDDIENSDGETEFLNITDISGMWRLSYDSKNKTIYLINKENRERKIILEGTQDAELIKEMFQDQEDSSDNEKFEVQHINIPKSVDEQKTKTKTVTKHSMK